MTKLTTLALGVVLLLGCGVSSQAAGLGSRRSPYSNMTAGKVTTTTTHVQLNRASTGYRRSNSVIQGRQNLSSSSSRSTLRRAAGEVFGYDARDDLSMGAGRRAARNYDDPRDQAVAGQRTRRVVEYASRIGSTVRRIIQR